MIFKWRLFISLGKVGSNQFQIATYKESNARLQQQPLLLPIDNAITQDTGAAYQSQARQEANQIQALQTKKGYGTVGKYILTRNKEHS